MNFVKIFIHNKNYRMRNEEMNVAVCVCVMTRKIKYLVGFAVDVHDRSPAPHRKHTDFHTYHVHHFHEYRPSYESRRGSVFSQENINTFNTNLRSLNWR